MDDLSSSIAPTRLAIILAQQGALKGQPLESVVLTLDYRESGMEPSPRLGFSWPDRTVHIAIFLQ
jgi:hypothetical protein